MKAAQVRQSFLDFFAGRGHEKVASSSLVPSNDPTLLFTNAGMVQFKDVFTGHEVRAIRRATTAQKCVRAGGKHNDLDEVGKTPRHHTFFEMLGNFSFGDYFKEDAIAWAWELLTGVWGMDPQRLVVTIFGGDSSLGIAPDDEARAIWKRVTGFGDDRILGLGMADNFWMMGETGPMGPCSEIHYSVDAARAGHLPTTAQESWNGWLEIWNLVFMQYERRETGGPMHKLPAPSIDTGAGLERVTSVLQGVGSNYETDLFTPLLREAAEISGKQYRNNADDDMSMRVIADHARTAAFLIADGVFPDKTGREYVLRRIFRRAVRHGERLGIGEPFMHRVCARVVAEMKDVYPELGERATVIQEVALEEEKRFRATLVRGLSLLEDEFGSLRKSGDNTLSGDKVFMLYDTFGFPEDLTEIIAHENGFAVDMLGFQTALNQARERSRFDGAGGEAVAEVFKQLASELGTTRFVGYETTSSEASARAILEGGRRIERARTGAKVALVVDQTPFYAESGGQIGDAGEIRTSSGARVRIDDTKKPAGDLYVHLGEVVAGELAVGDRLHMVVDADRRQRIRANHSATHLLHLALKKVLGPHVAQKGSLVAPDRLRFDFSHFAQITDEQKRQIEDWVNTEVLRNVDSVIETLPIAEARQRGAVAMFGEKYGDRVRVIKIGNESLEFCGGTHVARAGDIGLCKIMSESSIAQGVRRIEAVTGMGSLEYVRRLEDELSRTGARLKVAPFEVAERVDKLQAETRQLDREIAQLKARLASGGGGGGNEVMTLSGHRVVIGKVPIGDAKALREAGDRLINEQKVEIVLLAGIESDKQPAYLVMVKGAPVKANELMKQVATVSGSRGGGRPDLAQGGGGDPDKVDLALKTVEEYLRLKLEKPSS